MFQIAFQSQLIESDKAIGVGELLIYFAHFHAFVQVRFQLAVQVLEMCIQNVDFLLQSQNVQNYLSINQISKLFFKLIKTKSPSTMLQLKYDVGIYKAVLAQFVCFAKQNFGLLKILNLQINLQEQFFVYLIKNFLNQT